MITDGPGRATLPSESTGQEFPRWSGTSVAWINKLFYFIPRVVFDVSSFSRARDKCNACGKRIDATGIALRGGICLNWLLDGKLCRKTSAADVADVSVWLFYDVMGCLIQGVYEREDIWTPCKLGREKSICKNIFVNTTMLFLYKYIINFGYRWLHR